MANKKGVTAAAITVAVAVFQPMSIGMIEAIAVKYGIDKNTVFNIASEVLSAKKVAESDMRVFNKQQYS